MFNNRKNINNLKFYYRKHNAEIYTDVFSRIEEEIEKLQYKINYNMIRNKVNVIREISKDKERGKDSVWMWMTNRKVSQKNVLKIS